MQNRSAIALMLTLFMLLAMSAALSITLALFQKTFRTYNSNSFRIQSAVLMVDAVNLMNALSKDIEASPEGFSLLVQSAEELGRFFERASVRNTNGVCRRHEARSVTVDLDCRAV